MAEVRELERALATVRPLVVVNLIAQVVVTVAQTTTAPMEAGPLLMLAATELSLFPTFQLQPD
jgi:hypothetical protein